MFIGVVRRFQFDTFPWNGLIDVVRVKRLTRSGAQVLRMYSVPKVLRRSKICYICFCLKWYYYVIKCVVVSLYVFNAGVRGVKLPIQSAVLRLQYKPRVFVLSYYVCIVESTLNLFSFYFTLH